MSIIDIEKDKYRFMTQVIFTTYFCGNQNHKRDSTNILGQCKNSCRCE